METHTQPVTMWFDHRLAMRRSPIHGIGTFATAPIQAGERLIFVSGGIVYTAADWRSGKVQLEPTQYNEAQIGEASPNYLLEPCACGATLCRGRVTGNDWQIPALQQRYRGYFSTHIENLIRAAKKE